MLVIKVAAVLEVVMYLDGVDMICSLYVFDMIRLRV